MMRNILIDNRNILWYDSGMKNDVDHFCRALGAELKARFQHTKHPNTRERLRLHQLAEMADTTETTLRTLFRGGVKQMDLRTVLRVCAALGVHIIDVMHAAKSQMEGGK